MLRNFLKSKTNIFSPEILREVTNNGDNLSDLLQQASNEQLEPNCLNEALIAAVQNDHHQNVGKLIVKGASNISEALKLSVNEKKVHASAMLMLVYAAMEGNCNLIRQLFDEIRIEDQPCKECSNSSGGTYALVSRMLNQATSERDSKDCLQSVRRALKTSHMPTTIPIEIARRNITGHTSAQRARRCAHVREELLMKTDMNKEEKYVHWQGLGLRSIEVTWLKRVDWVKTLLIGRNQLRSLPAHIGVHLKQVSKTTSVFLSMFSHVHSYGAGISENTFNMSMFTKRPTTFCCRSRSWRFSTTSWRRSQRTCCSSHVWWNSISPTTYSRISPTSWSGPRHSQRSTSRTTTSGTSQRPSRPPPCSS